MLLPLGLPIFISECGLGGVASIRLITASRRRLVSCSLYWSCDMAKPPNIKHRMKRPQPLGAKPGRIEHDIKKALTTEQLAEIGAISLKFNQIESLIEFILLVILDIPPLLSWDVIRRINARNRDRVPPSSSSPIHRSQPLALNHHYVRA